LREALFIKKNKDRWTQIEREPSSDPDEMATDFIQLVDDLSYAKTFYPTSKTTRFLNIAASKIYLGIYKNRREEGTAWSISANTIFPGPSGNTTAYCCSPSAYSPFSLP